MSGELLAKWTDADGLEWEVWVPKSNIRGKSSTPDVAFECPRCGAVSHNPTDVAEGYCGRCHDWTGERKR